MNIESTTVKEAKNIPNWSDFSFTVIETLLLKTYPHILEQKSEDSAAHLGAAALSLGHWRLETLVRGNIINKLDQTEGLLLHQ